MLLLFQKYTHMANKNQLDFRYKTLEVDLGHRWSRKIQINRSHLLQRYFLILLRFSNRIVRLRHNQKIVIWSAEDVGGRAEK